ncbi:Putative signal transduction protein with EFhand domain (modular protein) [Syntrophobacter sp. SbD1]|nr:Putative signal transduction protein with EFhand domain (modular protein) [Syntrophobacter sp. SbD1]
MKRFKLAALMGLGAVFLLAGMAFAQWQGGQSAQRMGCQERFDALDTNHDGKLTLEEFMAAPHDKGNPEQMFKTMDVNGHGYITKEEFCSGQGMGRRRGKGIRQGQEGETSNEDKKEKEKLDKEVDEAIKKAWEEK